MANTDFNGDGRDDILWRNSDATVTDWLAAPDGTFVSNWDQFRTSLPYYWMTVATGDFNGDGRSDVLWIQNGGKITNWLGTVEGGFVANWDTVQIDDPQDRVIAGVGDFNGDGREDVFLWSYSGAASVWLGTPNGNFDTTSVPPATFLPTSWNTIGVGDFNGDNLADVLWRDAETGQLTSWRSTGTGFAPNSNALYDLPKEWSVVGVGDFNGDGHDDILLRRQDGGITDWLGTGSGEFVRNYANFSVMSDTHWNVASIGDYDGDGRDDILWQNANGGVTNWLATDAAGFVANWDRFNMNVGPDWHIPPDWDPWAY